MNEQTSEESGWRDEEVKKRHQEETHQFWICPQHHRPIGDQAVGVDHPWQTEDCDTANSQTCDQSRQDPDGDKDESKEKAEGEEDEQEGLQEQRGHTELLQLLCISRVLLLLGDVAIDAGGVRRRDSLDRFDAWLAARDAALAVNLAAPAARAESAGAQGPKVERYPSVGTKPTEGSEKITSATSQTGSDILCVII